MQRTESGSKPMDLLNYMVMERTTFRCMKISISRLGEGLVAVAGLSGLR